MLQYPETHSWHLGSVSLLRLLSALCSSTSPCLGLWMIGHNAQLPACTLRQQQFVLGVHLDVNGCSESLVLKGEFQLHPPVQGKRLSIIVVGNLISRLEVLLQSSHSCCPLEEVSTYYMIVMSAPVCR